MFSGRGKLLRIVLLFAALVVLGVIQWQSQKSKRDQPLFGTVRVIVAAGERVTTSCKDWRVDVYLENDSSYEIELNGFTIHTRIGDEEEQTDKRGELSTKSDSPLWEVSRAKHTRIWHADDGCELWATRGNWRSMPVDVQYKATVYTSDGIFSGTAGTKVEINQ